MHFIMLETSWCVSIILKGFDTIKNSVTIIIKNSNAYINSWLYIDLNINVNNKNNI